MRSIAAVSLCAGLLACGLDTSGSGAVAPDEAGTDVAIVDAQPADDAAKQGTRDGGMVDDAQTAPEASSDAVAVEAAPPCAGDRTSCGSPGACVDCTGKPGGSACVAGACGCTGPGDCPMGQACSSHHTCSASCAGGLACNGGCCDGTSCQNGTSDDACGSDGGSCTDCRTSGDDQACINGSACGCPEGSDCQGGGS